MLVIQRSWIEVVWRALCYQERNLEICYCTNDEHRDQTVVSLWYAPSVLSSRTNEQFVSIFENRPLGKKLLWSWSEMLELQMVHGIAIFEYSVIDWCKLYVLATIMLFEICIFQRFSGLFPYSVVIGHQNSKLNDTRATESGTVDGRPVLVIWEVGWRNWRMNWNRDS